jgi:hypothetical protein
MTFCAAYRYDDKVILFEASVDFGHVHRLVIDAVGTLHVTAIRWKFPFSHMVPPLMNLGHWNIGEVEYG